MRDEHDVSSSTSYFESVRDVIPTGFTSTGRQRSRGLAFESASGSHLTDVDGNDYVDMVLGLGPIIVGHQEPAVVTELHRQLDHAVIFGGETTRTHQLTQRLQSWIPGAQKIVFTNTGSEAVQVALRVARAATGKTKVIKFEGHYHGWLDPMLINVAGSAPMAPGDVEAQRIPAGAGQVDAAESLLVTRWNDIGALREVIEAHRGEVAAVIMEPIPLNFGSYMAHEGYLEGVRQLCTEEGAMLVFDEVVSGFRLDRAGAQGVYGVTPDLAAYAKGIAGGIPLAMVAGLETAMVPLDGGMLGHMGTYNANPFSIAAADATTRLMEQLPDLHTRLEASGAALQAGLREVAQSRRVPLLVNRVGSVLQLLWNIEGDGGSYRSCSTTDKGVIATLCEGMADAGIYTHPRGIMFMSYRHSDDDNQHVVRAFDEQIARLVS